MNCAGYIYKIVNRKNNKIYIGKTIKSIDKRFNEHLSTAKRWAKEELENKKHPYQSKLYPAMNKYGYNNFYIELVEEVFLDNSLEEREQYWISFYNTTFDLYGYNISLGGKGGPLFKGHAHSEQAKQKISKLFKGIKQSEEFIKKRTQPRIRYLQNLNTGEVEPATKYNYTKKIEQSFIDYTIYRANKQFFINIGVESNLKSILTEKERFDLLEKLNNLLLANKMKSVNAMHKAIKENQLQVKAKIKDSLSKIQKDKQKKYWENYMIKNNIDKEKYIFYYKQYQKNCPNKHLELIFNIPYNQIRRLNNYLGLKGGSSAHGCGKVSI